MQKERITRADIEAFGTTAGCPGGNAIRSDPCRVRIEGRLKMTPEGAERLDRRSEVLIEALAKEVERNVRRREETGSDVGELAVPREPKDVPISSAPDFGKRLARKAATADASSGKAAVLWQTSPEWMSRDKRETNPDVRQNRTSGEES